jgi:hypothetical protein
MAVTRDDMMAAWWAVGWVEPKAGLREYGSAVRTVV